MDLTKQLFAHVNVQVSMWCHVNPHGDITQCVAPYADGFSLVMNNYYMEVCKIFSMFVIIDPLPQFLTTKCITTFKCTHGGGPVFLSTT